MEYPELWNCFIDEVYSLFLKDKDKLFSDEQRSAIIAFAYDAHVNNGGHINFLDVFGDVFTVDEVAQALHKVGGGKFAANFLSAASHIHYIEDCGYMDDDEDADTDPIEDDTYYGMDPALPDLLEAYIVENRTNIFM